MRDLRPTISTIALLTTLAAALPAPAGAQSKDLGSYVLFALHGLRTKGVTVNGSGNIGVNDADGMISASSHNGIDGPQSQVVADLVRISDKSRCSALFANGVAEPMPACGPASPVTLPLFSNPAAACGFPTPFPSGPPGGCGQNAKIVFDGNTMVLQPGTYGDVRVFGGGHLVLAGGSQPYVFCSLMAGRNGNITAQHAATVQIVNTVNLSNATFLGPDPSAQPPISAHDVQLFVNGSAVHFSGGSDIHARLCAPNGNLRITHGSNIEGNFVAGTIRTERITAGLPPGSGTTTTTTPTTTTRPSTTSTSHHGTTTTTIASCTGDTSKLCGNGHIDCNEECDGNDFGDQTCAGDSAAGAHLRCKPDCTIDRSGCPCGNGVVDASEECDPTAVPTGCPADKTCGAVTDPTSACRCVVKEICGNCIDDDGNGLTDFEDPACCPSQQTFTMSVTRGRLHQRGAVSKLILRSILGSAGLENVNPLKQDVFIQIREPNGPELFCAHAPAMKFMKMHHAFKFWDKKHVVTSVKGIQDIKIIPPRKKRHDTRFRTFGKKVQLQTPSHGPLQVTVGFHDPTSDAGNICASQVEEFRVGRKGKLLAP
jgi:hypothetical protein